MYPSIMLTIDRSNLVNCNAHILSYLWYMRRREYRRVFHQVFNANAVKILEPREARAAHQLLVRLIDRPGDVMNHIKQYVYLFLNPTWLWSILESMAGSVFLSITYDIEVQPENDPFVAISQEVVHAVKAAFIPSAFWVVSSSNTWHKHSIREQDFFPWLKYIPAWFPGAGFRRKARKWSAEVRQMIEQPYAVAKQKFVCCCFQSEVWALLCFEQNEGKTLNSSFVSQSLGKLKDEPTVKNVAATMYAAGSDTVSVHTSNGRWGTTCIIYLSDGVHNFNFHLGNAQIPWRTAQSATWAWQSIGRVSTDFWRPRFSSLPDGIGHGSFEVEYGSTIWSGFQCCDSSFAWLCPKECHTV